MPEFLGTSRTFCWSSGGSLSSGSKYSLGIDLSRMSRQILTSFAHHFIVAAFLVRGLDQKIVDGFVSQERRGQSSRLGVVFARVL